MSSRGNKRERDTISEYGSPAGFQKKTRNDSTPQRFRKEGDGDVCMHPSSMEKTGRSSLDGREVSVPNRRSTQRVQYFILLQALKKCMAGWASDKLKQMKEGAEREGIPAAATTCPPKFNFGEVSQYLRYEEELRRIYLRNSGIVKMFGMGDCGQLGLSDLVLDAKVPLTVKTLPDNITLLACGGLHTVALNKEGELFTWGCNDDGSLGLLGEEVATAFDPRKVDCLTQNPPDFKTRPPRNDAIKWISAGDAHVLALSDDGKVYFFGSYKDKEGRHWRDISPPNWPLSPREEIKGKQDTESCPKVPQGQQDFPSPVHLMKDHTVDMVVCGSSFNAAILDDHSLLMWGMGECGELGRPTPEIRDKDTGKYHLDIIKQHYLTPTPPLWSTGKSHKVSRVACGNFHTLVITQEMQVATAGLNNYGQLGLGDTKNRNKLTIVTDLDGRGIRDIGGGGHHSLCVDEAGRMISFGRGDSGQLGITDSIPDVGYFESTPMLVLLPGDQSSKEEPKDPIKQISCGTNHNLAISDSGNVYTWGYGDMSALGHGRDRDEYRPRKLKLDDGINVYQAVGGGQHSAILCKQSH